MKNRSNLILSMVVLLLWLFTSCTSNIVHNKLVVVDSMLLHRNLDSASSILESLRYDVLKKNNKENFAYYFLLKARLDYMQYKPITTTSFLDSSISFFKEEHDLNKLVQAYFYKGAILYDCGNKKNGVLYIKKSENLAQKIQDFIMLNKIYKNLAIANMDAEEYDLALSYAKKSLILTNRFGDFIEKADIYNLLAICYGYKNNEKKALYYINKIIPLLKYVPINSKVMMLNNIAYFNMRTNPMLSLKYLNMAMRLNPSSEEYDTLAQLYIKMGLRSKADSLWNKALQTKDLLQKSNTIAAMLKQKQDEGNEKEALKLATLLLDLKDKVNVQRNQEKIKDLQHEYDDMTIQKEKELRFFRILFLSILCSFIVLLLSLYLKVRNIKQKKTLLEKDNELLEKQSMITSCQNSIHQLELSGKADAKVIENLKKRVEKLQMSKDAYAHQGLLLYQTAIKGLSIRNWNKPEMMAFLDHYASEDIEYSLLLEEKGCYTPRQKVFLILKHEGKTENKIAEMMGLSNAALRTMKSRINNAQTTE